MMRTFVARYHAWALTAIAAVLLATIPVPGACTAEEPAMEFETPAALKTLRSLDTMPIDLAGAFSLIGIQNPQFLIAQQRVIEASAIRQLAAAQLLPTINLGTDFDSHTGPLQVSSGGILPQNRESFYIGAGAAAIGSGTTQVPGILWNLNVSTAYYTYLVSRQVQARQEAAVTTASNEAQLKVASAYLELVRAATQRAIIWQARQDFAEIARITAVFERAGQGRAADANRAVSELYARDAELIDAEGQVIAASAKLAGLLGLDTAVRLVPADRFAVPHSIVPEPIPLPEILAIAAFSRPEMAEQRAQFAQALLELDAAKMLPFSPNVYMGFSAGVFGGGSNLAAAGVGPVPGQERFGNFAGRTDMDAMVYWTLQNLGVGNKAQIAASQSRVRQTEWQQLILLNRVRAEVATAYVQVHTRFKQLETAEEAVRESAEGRQEDLNRIRGNEGLPIEALDSQRLLYRSRLALLNTVINYNLSQFQLYFAMGRPPCELLIRSTYEINPEHLGLPAPNEGKP